MDSLCVSPIVLAWTCNGKKKGHGQNRADSVDFSVLAPSWLDVLQESPGQRRAYGIISGKRQRIEKISSSSAEKPADRRKGRRIGGKDGGQSSQGASSGRGQNPSVAVEGRRRGRSQDAGEGGTAALRLSCFPRGGIGLRPLIAGEARLLAVGIGRRASVVKVVGVRGQVMGRRHQGGGVRQREQSVPGQGRGAFRRKGRRL